MFGFRSARGRAVLAGMVLVVLLAGVATLAVWRTRDMQQQHQELEHTSAVALALEHAQTQFQRALTMLSALVFSDDPALLAKYQDAAAAAEQQLNEARAAALAEGEPDEAAALGDLAERVSQFNEKATPSLASEADPAAAVQSAIASMAEMVPEADAIIADLEELAHEEQEELAARRAAADRAADTTLWLLIGFSAAAFVVAGGTVAMLMVSVVRPLASLRASARAITYGDLEARANVSGPEEVVSLARDFNEMTDALSAKTHEYVDTTNLTGDIIVKIDKHGRWAFLNDAACQFYGKQREELLGTDSRPSLHPEDKERTSQMVRQARAGKELVRGFVNRQITPMGIRVVEWNGYALFDGEGEYAGIQGTGRDITERQRAEEALGESEAELSAIYDNAPPVMILVDQERRVRKVNYTAMKFSQRSAEDMIGRRGGEALRCAHSLDDPEGCGFGASCGACPVRSLVVETFETGNDHYQVEANLELASAEGELTVLVSTTLLSLAEGQRVLVCIEDITERKRAEEALRLQSEITQNMAEAVYLIRASDGVIVYTNPAFERLFGYGPGEMIGKHVSVVNAPTDKSPEETAKEIITTLDRTGVWRGELLNIKKDGTLFWCYANVSTFDHPGHGRVWVTYHTDISERKRAEEALRESERRFSRLSGATFEGLVIHERGKILDANPAFARMFGYELSEVIGMHALNFTAPESRDLLWQGILSRREEPFEALGLRKDGSTLVCELRGRDIPYQERMVTVTAVRDISERKRAEEEQERLHAELELRAITDSLTGLYDHAHFYQRLAEEIDRSKRYNHGFAIVMLDVDDFKRFNDSRGHQAGDEMLCLVAKCIRSGLRRSDLAFRYGGDEFAAILPHAESSKARAAVDRMNRRITRDLKRMDGDVAGRLTLSAGVACFPDDGITADDLVRIADAALYSTKWVARARDIMGQREDIQSLVSALVTRRSGVEGLAGETILRPEALHEQQARIVSSVASSIAIALKDAGVAQALEDPDMQVLATVGAAAEIKDRHIRGHPERTSEQAAALAEEMGLSPEQVKDICIAGLLHDIGKVTVSEGILNKPGKLTRREFASIRDHPIVGATLVSQVRGFERLVPIVRHHHERFDGEGYPDGLAGEDIPLEARILSVVDVFDAMTHQPLLPKGGEQGASHSRARAWCWHSVRSRSGKGVSSIGD